MIHRVPRRAALAALATATLLPGRALAQEFPSRPVRFIVPFPPGNSTDIIARFVAEELSKRWPHRVVVENRSGGAGAVGMEAGARSPADGYTLTIGTSGPLGINPSIIPRLSYNAERDFAPITNLATMALVLVTQPRFEAKTVAELRALALARPGEISFGSPGPGTAGHMAGEMFAHEAGIRLTHVPYRGSGPAVADLLSGNLHLISDSLTSALPHVREGRMVSLAVTTRIRVPQMPEVPTVAETLGKPFKAVGWIGLVAPAGTPTELVQRINADVVTILRDPATADRLLSLGGTPDPRTPAEFGAFIRAEIAKWGEVARTANVRLDGAN
jgi:tripartite-type tricarboxylate transporter receptor subunit TctC